MKYIGKIAFVILLLLTCAMAIATFVEKSRGTVYVQFYFYNSPWFITCWMLTALMAIVYFVQKNSFRTKGVLLLHLSLLIILVGAFLTYTTSESGVIYLKEDVKQHFFNDDKRMEKILPFQLELKRFEIGYYPGTKSPADYSSYFLLHDKPTEKVREGSVSMNRIFTYKGYRFYQASFDNDLKGSTLNIKRDPWGIPVTYAGYFLLFASMLLVLTEKKGRFRCLLKHPALRNSALLCLFICTGAVASAGENSALAKDNTTISREQSKQFEKIWMLYNGRITPLQTYAHDFSMKLLGKTSYKNYNATQILCGWLFSPDKWENLELFKINDKRLQNILAVKNHKACLADFFDTDGNYKLAAYYKEIFQGGKQTNFAKEALHLDEKIQLIYMLQQGISLKIFPYKQENQFSWFAPTDSLPSDIPQEAAIFVETFFRLYHHAIIENKYADAETLLKELENFQQQNTGTILPEEHRRNIELFYNRSPVFPRLFMLNLTLGVLIFMLCIMEIIQNRRQRFITRFSLVALIISFSLLSFFFVLRSYIAGYWSMSNGFETMIFTAWCALLLSLLLHRYATLIPSFGLLISGFALLVAHLGNMNPQITPLVPVLSSSLLSIHVSLIMLSYALVAFLVMNSLMYLSILATLKTQTEASGSILKKLHILSQILLYPCAFFLGAGIFVGAIWANVSWGRYWGWDPKEVWALISFIIMSLGFHGKIMKLFNKAFFFHCYLFLIFASVLMTYFGVNHFLGGLHSYAGDSHYKANFMLIFVVGIALFGLMTAAYHKQRIKN